MSGVPAPILIIEDDPRTRNAMRALLTMDGYAVVTASTGSEALAELRAGLRPCLIALDLMLPHLEGFRFRHEQMQDRELSTIPVVVYSGRFSGEPQIALLDEATHVQKPLAFGAFIHLVETHCQRHALATTPETPDAN